MAKGNWVKLAGGDYAVPIRVEFLLTPWALIDVLCWNMRHTTRDEGLPKLTVPQVRERVRGTLMEAGSENIGYWQDYMSDDWATEIEAWAKPLIEKAFGHAPA